MCGIESGSKSVPLCYVHLSLTVKKLTHSLVDDIPSCSFHFSSSVVVAGSSPVHFYVLLFFWACPF